MKSYFFCLIICLNGLTVFSQEYCEVTYNNDIEPITQVSFADLENATSPEVNGSPGHEYFLDLDASLDEEETYPIILEGNTNGNFTNTFTVFIDWNDNGNLDDAGEVYFAGSITNSTGIDNQEAITEITIPYGSSGTKRMRVIKHRTSMESPEWPQDPCGIYEYGQTEDYTLYVTHGDEQCFFSYEGGLDNIVGDLQNKQIANDFVLSAQGTGNIYATHLEVHIFGNVSTADIYFYTENDGTPGSLLQTIEDLAPESQNFVANVFGVNVYKVVWEFPEPVFIGEEGPEIHTAWFGLTTTPGSEGVPNYMEAVDDWGAGSVAYYSEDGGNTWLPDPNGLDGAFIIYALCGEMDTEEISEFSFSYYPNPVTDHLKIQSDSKVEQFEVYNSEGKTVFQSSSVKNNELNLNSLSPGIYLIRVKLENGRIETFKIIKK